jgi:hypothetical protein
MSQDELNAKAFSLGYQASKDGLKRIPALDSKLCEMFKGQGNNVLKMLDSWLAGHQRFNDEEVAKLFPNDPYFQLK